MNVWHAPSTLVLGYIVKNGEKIMATIFSGLLSFLLGTYSQKAFLIKNVTSAIMCALISWYVYDVLLVILALPLEWVNLISVLIGFIGVDYTRIVLIRLVGKKFGKLPEENKPQ
ncbi:phage holin family protein [Rouxiella sp. T17]|uniref:phage holin family protein n=1 Tax=Rouxiella sp. T17 TaxID=3085684 RepID=UPI002FC86AAD